MRGVRQDRHVQGLRRKGLHVPAVRQNEVPKVFGESQRLRGLRLRDRRVHQVPRQRQSLQGMRWPGDLRRMQGKRGRLPYVWR
jgi:hypothetical protein